MTKPICKILVGLPGVGKSTFIRNDLFDYVKLSTDDIISNIADMYDTTYNKAFKDLITFADKIFWADIEYWAKDGDNIVIDRTNLSVKSRKKLIDLIKPYGYTIDAIVFETPEQSEWERRLASRPNKTIPPAILNNMLISYTVPTMDEGFDSITFVK